MITFDSLDVKKENLSSFYSRPVRLRNDYSFSSGPGLKNKGEDNKYDFARLNSIRFKGTHTKDVGFAKKKETIKAYSKFTYFPKTEGGIEEIKSIVNLGMAINGATFKDNYHEKKNVINCGLWIGDIDNTRIVIGEDGKPVKDADNKIINEYYPQLSLDDAKNHWFIKKYCLIYTSPSHKKNWHKFRIICFLPSLITGNEYEILGKYINKILGNCLDTNALESGRLFYGNTNAKWTNDDIEIHSLPDQWLDKIREESNNEIAQKEKQKTERLINKESAKSISKSFIVDDSLKNQVVELINQLPPRESGSGTYNFYRNFIWGCCYLWTANLKYQSEEYSLALDNLKEIIESSPLATNYGAKWNATKLIENYNPNYDPDRKIGLTSISENFTAITGEVVKLNIKYNDITFISGDQDFDEIDTTIFRQWKKEELSKLKGFKADKTIDKTRFYDDGAVSDPEIDSILDDNQVIVIRGSKASGKSYMMKQYIKRWRALGGKVVNIGCRRVLCESQSIEWDVTYIGNAENESYSLPVIFERDGGLSVVVDSLLKLKHIDWENTSIIIDEFEQFVNHLLTANTSVKDYRGYTLQLLEDKFKLSLATGGKIIALDADSSDITSDWLEGVTGIKPFKLDNICKSHNNNCFLFTGDKEGYNELIKAIFADLNEIAESLKKEDKESKDNRESKRKGIFIASDSRKDLEAIQIEVIKMFPDLPCEIITSDTVGEKYIRDFIKHPDKAIKDTQILMLGASPVMQSGVSINIKNYFSKIFGICTGIIEPSIMRQLLIRVRDNCDRFLWISDKAKGKYSNDFDYQKILKSDNIFFRSLPELAEYQKALNENLTREEVLIKIIGLLGADGRSTDIHSITKAKLTARRNLALSDYRTVLINELKNEGYIVHDDYESDARGFSDVDISATKKAVDMDKAIAVNNANDISSIEQGRLKNKPYPTKDEQNQLLKYAIRDIFPLVFLNPLFILNYILRDNWATLTAVKRFWFTQKNKEIAKKLDIKTIHYQTEVALTGGKFWLEDVKANTPYIELFERLGLSEFINDGLIVSKNSEQLKAFFERCKDYRKVKGISTRELLRSCGVKFANNIELVNLLRKVVKLFGFKLACVQQTKDNKGKTIRHYVVIRAIDNELWQQLIDSFDYKYQQLEPIKYDFELGNNDDFDSENCEIVSFGTENAVSYTHNDLDFGSLPTHFYKENNSSDPDLTQYTISDIGTLTEKLIFEPKLSSIKPKLIGEKCNFWDNNNQWSTGFVIDILDFGIKIKDYLTEKISFCDISQIEFLVT
jgi:hypothetical protein